jgi:hypothetical protein
MPEAAIYENCGFTTWQDHVGSAGQIFTMQTEAQPCPMESFSDKQLGSRSFGADAAHISTAGDRVDGVSDCNYSHSADGVYRQLKVSIEV